MQTSLAPVAAAGAVGAFGQMVEALHAAAAWVPPSPLMKPEDVAAMLNIERQTLAEWRCASNRGESLPFVKIGRAVRYRREDVARFIADRLQCA